MRVTVLGSASSQGIPQPFCSCPLCTHASGKDVRLRSSYRVKLNSGRTILLDASPDFREQQLSYKLDFDYLFLSHRHRDHIVGLEEIRIALQAHDAQNHREQSQKQRVFWLGKRLHNWLFNGPRNSRWEESTQQAYQQLLARDYFVSQVLVPGKKIRLSENLSVTYLKGKHGHLSCGGLVVKESQRSLVYLSDIALFDAKLKKALREFKPNLLIAHVPFFHRPEERIERERHAGVEEIKKLPAERILLSHFSHQVKLKHSRLSKAAKLIDSRFIVAFDQQELTV